MQMQIKNSRWKTQLVAVALLQLCASLALGGNNLPKPTDRWLKSNNTVLVNVPTSAVQVPIDNELPDGTPDVKVGTVVVDKNGNRMTVTQSTDRALIDWDSFNIGKNNSVEFKQPGQDSVALNRIYQQSPTKIFGSLKANGNIWLFNPNGIFFGKDSQVNVRGLIASALEFNGLDENNFADADLFGAINEGKPFLTNARLLADGSSYCVGDDCSIALDSDPSNVICDGQASCNDIAAQSIIQGGEAVTCTGSDCRQALPRIIIQQGANIATEPGGSLLMAAPEVINEGSLRAGDGGQAVLAGSKGDVYLAVTSKDSKNLRGFIVEVDSGSDHPEGGSVVNAGDITANLGNVTLVAKEIVQAGKLRSSTAVDVNGSIRLLARDGGNVLTQVKSGKSQLGKEKLDALYMESSFELPDTNYIPVAENPGTVILQEGSSTNIDIDRSDKTANNSLPQRPSEIHIEGKQVYMGKDAEIVAPAATVTIRARTNATASLDTPEPDIGASFIMDEGATIDVSGTTDTLLDASRNNLEFFVTSNELKDAWQQKDGPLLRQTIMVDIRRGTPLFDWTQKLDTVEKTALERNARGGRIDVRAGAVELGAGSTLDVSGGRVNFKGGEVESSWLLAGNGLVDIADAGSDFPYDGVLVGNPTEVVDPKWGPQKNYRPGPGNAKYYREAYSQGADAGYLHIEAGKPFYSPQAVFKAETYTGPWQRTPTVAPAGGIISLDFGDTVGNVFIANSMDDFGDDLVRGQTLLLASQLQNSGAGKFWLQANGLITIGTEASPVNWQFGNARSTRNTLSLIKTDKDNSLLDSGTDLLLKGAGVAIHGNIRAPGANIEIGASPALYSGDGAGVVSIDGLIDTSGTWNNDSRLSGETTYDEFVITDAGSVALSGSTLEIVSGEGKGIRANAGAWLNRKGDLLIGKAGNINLRATDPLFDLQTLELSAIDSGEGGILTLTVGSDVLIGGDTTRIDSEALVLGNDYFTNSQLGGYDFTASGDLTVVAGADIDLHHLSYEAPRQSSLESVADADSVDEVLNAVRYTGEEEYLAAPGRLTLTANRRDYLGERKNLGVLSIESGASIRGPSSSILTLSSDNRMLIDGTVQLPGGAVNAEITQTTNLNNPDEYNYLMIGNNARLDLSAAVLAPPESDPEALPTLVDAGEVNLLAQIGAVLVAAGADINLAGSTGNLTDVYGTHTVVNKTHRGLYHFSNIKSRDISVERTLLAAGSGVETYLNAGKFSLEAERGYALIPAINFGDRSSSYTGGELSLTLHLDTGRSSNSKTPGAPTLNVVVGGHEGEEQFSDFRFGDAYQAFGLGYVDAGSLSDSHIDILSIDTTNSLNVNGINYRNTAKNRITIADNVSLSANSQLLIDTNWLNINGNNLEVSAPYVQLGETKAAKDFDIDQQIPDGADLVAGQGQLSVNANYIDLVGNIAVTGANKTTLNASQTVRARSVLKVPGNAAPSISQNAWTSFGELDINTPLLTVSTLSDYVINVLEADGVSNLDIAAYKDPTTGKAAVNTEPVLSYGASLAANARTIDINSRVQVPFGAIELAATDTLTLGSNSDLSVAAVDDTLIPFGRTLSENLFWNYTLGSQTFSYAANPEGDQQALPDKRITLSAPRITARDGSVQDLSGGGRVFASEFFSGLGGSKDILNNQSMSDRFVIVKNLRSGVAPYDFVESLNSDIPWGTTFEVSGSSQLEDGAYTVLPASYAFLDNAYLIRPTQLDGLIIDKGLRSRNAIGSEIVSGRFNNIGASNETTWQAFVVEPGFHVDSDGTVSDPRGDYRVALLDNFFAPAAPGVLPNENGRMIIDVTGDATENLSLALNGSVRSSDASPIGTSIDVTASQPIVIGEGEATGVLNIAPGLAKKSGAESVLIGGRRSWNADLEAWQIEATTPELTLDAADLSGKEIVLTAKNSVALKNGAGVNATEQSNFAGNQWLVDAESAVLLASTGSDSRLLLDSADISPSSLTIDNSSVAASAALAAFYDGGSNLDGLQLTNRGRLQVSAGRLSVGTDGAASVGTSLLASAGDIELLAPEQLSFTSSLTLDNLTALKLQTRELLLQDNIDVSLKATGRVQLAGVGTAVVTTPSSLNSSLSLSGAEIGLGEGTGETASGAEGALLINSASLNLNAGQGVRTSGKLTLETSGDVAIKTPLISAETASEFDLTVAGSLLLEKVKAAQDVLQDLAAVPGAVYRFVADSIGIDTTIDNPSGLVEAVARNGDIDVGNNASIDVSSFSLDFPDTTNYAPTGVISLAASGDINVDDATGFVFGDTQRRAQDGLLELYADGALNLGANGREGRWSGGGMDLSIYADTLNVADLSWLNQHGFDGDLSVIVNGADAQFKLDANSALSAENLELAVTRGRLSLLDGASLTITDADRDAVLYGGQGVDVLDGATVTMRSKQADNVKLVLQSIDGDLVVEGGARFDLDGGLALAKSVADTSNKVVIDAEDRLTGPIDFYLAKSYLATTLNQTAVESDFNDLVAAIGSTTATDIITTPYNVAIKPLLDIYSTDTLRVSSGIDMLGMRFNGNPGLLQLRAAGDIDVNAGLGDGVVNRNTRFYGIQPILAEDYSWSFNIAAGADTAHKFAASTYAFDRASAADLSLANGSYIRTGTGDISVTASGDINLGAATGDRAYIATVGRANYVSDPAFGTGPEWGDGESYVGLILVLNKFSGISLESGDVDLSARGGVYDYAVGGKTPASYIQMLAPPDTLDFSSGGFSFDYSGRIIRTLALKEMTSGIQAIAGGDVRIRAAGDIYNLSAATPGVAQGASQSGEYQLKPGGKLQISSRGDLISGSFANDGASINVRTFGDVRGPDSAKGEYIPSFTPFGASSGKEIDPSLFLVGAYSDISIVAGGDVQFDGMTNTTMLPLSVQQKDAAKRFVLEDTAGIFYAGYEQTRVNLTSVGGDINYTGNKNNMAGVLGDDLQENLGQSSDIGAEPRFTTLAPQQTWQSFQGDISYADNVTLFPSAVGAFDWRAYNTIASVENGASTYALYLPDFDVGDMPSSDNVFKTDVKFGISDYARRLNFTARADLPITKLVDRSSADISKFYALTGDIGSSAVMTFWVPNAIDVYAGRDVRNTSFIIQHSHPGDISSIRADRDIVYDIHSKKGSAQIDDRGNLGTDIQISGPGDLIFSAGGDVELGASNGIVSLGNTRNSLLDSQGASVHVLAGYDRNAGDFAALVGDGIKDNNAIAGLGQLGLNEQQRAAVSLSDWFSYLAVGADASESDVLINAVGKATGESYSSVEEALSAWRQLQPALQLRVSTYAIKELALASPALLVDRGALLFGKKPLGDPGFGSSQNRSQAFGDYWNSVSGLIALDALLAPNREADLLASLPEGMDLAAFSALPVSEQVNLAVNAFGASGKNQQFLVAEQVLNQQLRQSSAEAAASGSTVSSFERGFVAMRRFFGESIDGALAGAELRIKKILNGGDNDIKPAELNFGLADGVALNSFSDVLAFWQGDSGENFNLDEITTLQNANSIGDLTPRQLDAFRQKYGDDFGLDPSTTESGKIDLVFSSIRTEAPGASINLFAPTGKVDVGVSADLIKSLGVKTDSATGAVDTGRLGVLTKFYGDVNGVVASGFNVNESRAFSLAGGAINLWSTWGDIDAGKGAKTATSTPEASFTINPQSGAITKINPAAVSGSGIQTKGRLLASSSSLSDDERFYQVAPGAGPAYLATPLGVVDAGEAGIQVDRLFVGAQQIKGTDNITSHVSVGLVTTTAVDASVASSGNSANQASSTATNNLSNAASRDAASSTSAFVTIELLDTGIGLSSGSSSNSN